MFENVKQNRAKKKVHYLLRRVLACTLATLLMLTVPSGAAKASNGNAESNSIDLTTMEVINCNEWISLRTHPDTSSQRLTTIPLGAYVTYISTAENGFYKVSYDGMVGFALASYLTNTTVNDGIRLGTIPLSAPVIPDLKREVCSDDGLIYNHFTIRDQNDNLVAEEMIVGPIGAELPSCELLTGKGDFFYFIDHGMLKAYSYETGELVWTSYGGVGYVAPDSFAVDSEGTLYVADYYSNNLTAFNSEGQIIGEVRDFGDKAGWPTNMEIKESGELEIIYEIPKQFVRTIVPSEWLEEYELSNKQRKIMEVCESDEEILLLDFWSLEGDKVTSITPGDEVIYFFSRDDFGEEFAEVAYKNYRGYMQTKYLKDKE